MGKRGLAIAVSPKTSDLWQGDEAKWQETYPKGSNGFHSGRVKLDKSTNKWESQISRTVAIDGELVGALTVGIDVVFRGDR